MLQPSTTNTSKKILYPNRQGEIYKSNVAESRTKISNFTPTPKSNSNPVSENQKSSQQTSTLQLNRTSNANKAGSNVNFHNNVKVDPEKISNLEKEVIEATKTARNDSHNTSLDTSVTTTNSREKTFDSNPSSEHCEFERRSYHLNECSPQNIFKNAPKFSFRFGVTRSGANVSNSKHNSEILNPLETDNTNVPPYVQKNLKKLIGNYPDGVWCAELPQIYR